MTPSDRRLVLVVGPPRSGTTAVGEVLGTAPHTATLHEPTNFHTGDRRVRRYFDFLSDGGEELATLRAIEADVKALRLRLKTGAFPNEAPHRQLLKRLIGGRTTWSLWKARLTPALQTIVWKDPFMTFSLQQLQCFRQAPVVACYRPPEAVAASFKRLNWRWSATEIAAALGRDSFETAGDQRDAAFRGADFWALAYTELLEQARSGRYLRFLDLDDVVADPVGTYRRVFAFCGLEWTDRVERRLTAAFGGTESKADAVPRAGQTHVKDRDLGAVNTYWSKVLSATEIDYIRARTQPLVAQIQQERPEIFL
ncbi:MAG: sulfotransferase [Pseudomonadota bacterium]